MPTMMMGSAATFIDCDESWKLLLVTKKGSLYLWDLCNRNCLLHDSLASLLSANPNAATKDTGSSESSELFGQLKDSVLGVSFLDYIDIFFSVQGQ